MSEEDEGIPTRIKIHNHKGHEDEYYYDKDANKYYLSKEHYLKAKGLSLKVEPGK